METREIKHLIEAGIVDCEANVSGDGSHFDATVISPAFAGLSMVKKQQLVYATLGDRITNGSIHALTIKTYTPEEWETQRKLQVSF
ncbi:MAG: BolA family protein [Thiohalomonadaceae bacterium]